MGRQNLPIYARTRATEPRSSLRRHRPFVTVMPTPLAQVPLPVAASPTPYQLSTLAGRADTVWHSSNFRQRKALPLSVWRSGFRDGPASKALFNKPTGLAVDRHGHVYVADSLNHCIRKISRHGKVSTLVGNGERGHVDGLGRKARLNHPTGLALGPEKQLYVVDQGNGSLRCLQPSGQISTLAIPGRPLGGIVVASGWIYLLLETQVTGRASTVLARVNPQNTESSLLAEWEGKLQWLPYRQDEEQQPFSRWWLQRQHRPQPLLICEPEWAEGLGLTADSQGHLYWLAQRQLCCLQQTSEQLSLHRQTLQLGYAPSTRWQGLSIDPEGVLYTLDATHHQLYRLHPGGSLEAVLAGHPVFSKPHSVVQDSYGQLYISDTGHWRVCRVVPPGRDSLLQLARLSFLPYLGRSQASPQPLPLPEKGIWTLVRKHLQRWKNQPDDLSPAGDPNPGTHPAVAKQHILDVLSQGKRSQQLACVRELVDYLRTPLSDPAWPATRPIFEQMLSHPDISVRTLLIRHICDLVHQERDALLWLELLEQHRESNRLLKKYLVEVLAFLGRRYELYGHVVPLMVEFVQAREEDVVEHVFQHLLKIRQAGYESLVDPLLEEFSAR